MTNTELEKLRSELDAYDAQILALVAKRLELVKSAYHEKRKQGDALFDREREREVYQKAEQTARRVGLDPSAATGVIRAVVEASHLVQDQTDLERDMPEDAGTGRNFLIVGGRGQMGRRFFEALVKRGHAVDVLEIGDQVSQTALQKADVVIIAVPMQVAANVAREVSPAIREDALLTDINSLKSEICAVYREHCHGESLGLHPMFGPTVKRLWRQKMILCPVRSGPMASWFSTELGRMGFDLIETDAETHDRMMGVIQVLTHFHAMVTGEALKRSGLELKKTLPFMSPIYKLELAVIGRLFAQDPDLYAEIEMANPAGKELREMFLQSGQSLEQLIESGNRDAFRKTFLGIRSYFQEFSTEALALSDMIIDTVVSRP